MKKVVININELGPVKEQVIELKPVMLFTGESGLGKSYVNFLAYYLFYVFSSERLYDFLLERIGTNITNKKDFSFSLNTGELIDWLQNDVKKFFIYLYNFDDFKCDVKFTFKGVEDVINIKYSRVDNRTKDNEYFIFQIDINNKSIRSITFKQHLDKTMCRVICKHLCRELLGVRTNRSFLLTPGRASLLTGDFTVQQGSSKLCLYRQLTKNLRI